MTICNLLGDEQGLLQFQIIATLEGLSKGEVPELFNGDSLVLGFEKEDGEDEDVGILCSCFFIDVVNRPRVLIIDRQFG